MKREQRCIGGVPQLGLRWPEEAEFICASKEIRLMLAESCSG